MSTPDDPDQEVSLLQFASLVLDLVSQAVRAGKTNPWFADNKNANLNATIRLVAGWTQMTDEDVSLLTDE